MSAKCHEQTKLRFRSCFAWHRNQLRRRTSLWVRSAFRRRAIIKDSQQQGARLGGCIGAANRDLAGHFAGVFCDDFPECVALDGNLLPDFDLVVQVDQKLDKAAWLKE
jgi:hypothetical protein